MQFTAQLCTYCILCVQIASPFFFLQKKIGVYFDPRACLIAMCQHNYGQRQLMNLYEQVWCCCFSHALRALAKSCSCCWQDQSACAPRQLNTNKSCRLRAVRIRWGAAFVPLPTLEYKTCQLKTTLWQTLVEKNIVEFPGNDSLD